jgi:hypothetical protein
MCVVHRSSSWSSPSWRLGLRMLRSRPRSPSRHPGPTGHGSQSSPATSAAWCHGPACSAFLLPGCGFSSSAPPVRPRCRSARPPPPARCHAGPARRATAGRWRGRVAWGLVWATSSVLCALCPYGTIMDWPSRAGAAALSLPAIGRFSRGQWLTHPSAGGTAFGRWAQRPPADSGRCAPVCRPGPDSDLSACGPDPRSGHGPCPSRHDSGLARAN